MCQRKRRDGRLKAQAALEAIKSQHTISQIASEYGRNPSSEWIASTVEIPARCIFSNFMR